MLNRYLLAPLAALALLAAPHLTHAQTGAVGIGTTAPDASAALDIVSGSKGALLPRVASTANVPTPATGLLVFQTGGTPGFYYNAGTPAAPSWQQLNVVGGAGDNLGNHTATQALNLQGNALIGTGADLGTAVGLGVRADGGLNIGQNTPNTGFFLGYQAGSSNTGYANQFVGIQSGASNTTGQGNHFNGIQSGLLNTTGSFNTFGGFVSGQANTTGSDNVYLGYSSGSLGTTGSGNTFVGNRAGQFNDTGSENTILGTNSGPAQGSGPLNNATALGAGVSLTTSNTVVLGNGASVGIGTSSPSQRLEVAGTIFSSAGGFRFPDNTTQTTAATDAQALSISGNTLSLTNGGSVPLASLGDNLGNHTATQNLNLGTFRLVGNGGTAGLVIDATGRVGIGSTPPAAALDVNGSIWSRNTVRVDANDTNNGGLSNNAGLYFGLNGSNEGMASKRTSGGNQYGLDFYTANTNRLAIGNNGNVGIGTAPGANKLDVSGTLRSLMTNGSFFTTDFGPSGGRNTALLGYFLGSGASFPQLRFQSTTGSKFMDIGQNDVGDFVVEGNDVARLTVLGTGNVGIGTTATPETKLDVNGSLRLAVRVCPANTTNYQLLAADLAFSVFKTQDGSAPATLTLPPASAGQVLGQQLTIYNRASTTVTISGSNTDNSGSIALEANGTNGTHGATFLWDGVWIRIR